MDAKDKILGKLAQRIGIALRGKYKPHFNPAGSFFNTVDNGDYVVVKNAKYIALSGNKTEDKKYYWHSGYPGGLKSKTFEVLHSQNPTAVDLFHLAIKKSRVWCITKE